MTIQITWLNTYTQVFLTDSLLDFVFAVGLTADKHNHLLEFECYVTKSTVFTSRKAGQVILLELSLRRYPRVNKADFFLHFRKNSSM